MSVKTWPKAVKVFVAWLLVLATIAILAGTTAVLLSPFLSGRGFANPYAPWSNILAHYTTLITAPIAVTCSIAASRYLWRNGDRKLVMFLVVGVAVGVGAGLVLAPVTGGFSVISAPPFAGATTLLSWITLKALTRDTSNPPTPTP